MSQTSTIVVSSSIELQEDPDALATRRDTSQGNTSSNEEYPRGIRFILLTIGLVLSIFLAALDSTIISTAIPKITNQFGTVADVGWYGSGYAVTNAAFQSTWGKAYKYFPIKQIFLTTIMVFELGNVVSATAQSSAAMILGRVIAGVGGGGVMTGCFIVIAFSSKPQYRAAYMGVLGVTFGCAAVIGPLMGGVLSDGPGWRWCFWISLPIGFAAAAIMALTFRPPAAARPAEAARREKVANLDLPGSLLVMTALIAFVLGTQLSTHHGWTSWRTILCLTSFGFLLSLFAYNEYRMESRAIIQTHLLKSRRIVMNLLFSFLIAGLFFPLSYMLPIQFQTISNTSASQSGIRLIPLQLGVSIFTMVANGIITFWKHYTPFLLAGALSATIGVVMVHQLAADASIAKWIGFEILAASGIGLSLQIPMIANQALVGMEDMASVTSLTLFCENVGQALFIAATEAVFTSGLIESLKDRKTALDPETVINTGATQIRTAVSKEELSEVLASYLRGCKDSHWVPIACGIAAVAVSMVASVPGVRRELGRWRKKADRR